MSALVSLFPLTYHHKSDIKSHTFLFMTSLSSHISDDKKYRNVSRVGTSKKITLDRGEK